MSACMYVGNMSMDLLASMRYLACVPHYLLVTLVLIARMTLEDESNTHLALGRGVRGEGAWARGHGGERGSIRGSGM